MVQAQIAEYREMKLKQEREKQAIIDAEKAEKIIQKKSEEAKRRQFMDMYKDKLKNESSTW
jgi:hypothetical protein